MKRRTLVLLLVLLLCFPRWLLAQDDAQWTCDDLLFFDCWGKPVNNTGKEYVEGVVYVGDSSDPELNPTPTPHESPLVQAITLRTIGLEYENQGRYAEALDYYNQALAILRNIKDRPREGWVLNDIGLVYYTQGQYAAALNYFQQALVIASELNDEAFKGIALNNIGLVYDAQGTYDVALSYYFQALAIHSMMDNEVDKAMTLGNIAGIYHNQGHYAEALDYYNQALAIHQETDNQPAQSMTLNNLGSVYEDQGQYAAALDSYTQALAIALEIDYPTGEGVILHNMAGVYADQGRYVEALNYYNQALMINQELGIRPTEGTILDGIGFVYLQQGQYATALSYHAQALEIAREVGNRAGEGAAFNNIGQVYDGLGQYENALSYYFQALSIEREIGNQPGEATTLNNIGQVYDQRHQYPAALEYLMQALTIKQEIGDRPGEGASLNNIGAVYGAQGQYSLALDYFHQALAIDRELGAFAGEGATLNNIAVISKYQGQYDTALSYCTQAISIQHEIGNRTGEIAALGNRGWIYEGLQRLNDAIPDYKAAVEVIETVQSNAALGEILAALRSQSQNNYPYQRLAVLLAQQGDYVSALDYAERGRAVLARTELSTDSIDFRAELEDADLLTTETDLRLALDSAQNYLNSLKKDASVQAEEAIPAADAAVKAAQRSYEQHVSLMQLQGGFLAREIAREAASLDQIQAALPTDTTLVLYAVGYPNSAVFLVTSSSLDALVLDVTGDTLTEQVGTFATDRRANADVLREVYDLVFAPIADQITTARLIIVPDGALNYVPFAALQAPDGSYLIDHYSISMVSSGTTLVLLNDRALQTQTEPTSPALVLAQPSAPGLATLRNAPLEALDVADLLGTEPNLNATEADLRASVPGSAVLYITAHAELDRFAPLFSVIHLGEGDNYDGRLEVREIYELDLTQGTELVVLSGCETASGGDGEDFGLLTRAFFAAGAPRVVASLWSVDDVATADLMTAFIAERSNYDNEADALRAAMLTTRQQYSEPYYWASFVPNGLP